MNPQRMCISCREMKDKNELARFVKTKDGTILFDESMKSFGRGAYVCKNDECVLKCLKTRALNRAFKTEIPNEIYEELISKYGRKN